MSRHETETEWVKEALKSSKSLSPVESIQAIEGDWDDVDFLYGIKKKIITQGKDNKTNLTGTNGKLEVKTFQTDSYNGRRTEDYLKRGDLLKRACAHYLGALEKNQKIKSTDKKLIDEWMKERWKRFAAEIKQNCVIPINPPFDENSKNLYWELFKEKFPNTSFKEWPSEKREKFYLAVNKKAKEIIKTYLASLAMTVENFYIDKEKPGLEAIVKAINKNEIQVVTEAQCPNIIHLDYEVGEERTEGGEKRTKTKMFSAQVTMGDKTIPSTNRSVKGPYNFKKEFSGFIGKNNEVETALVIYRGMPTAIGIKDAGERSYVERDNAEAMLKEIVKDKINAGAKINEPINITIALRSLLTALDVDKPGGADENSQLKNLIRAWKRLQYQTQPIKLDIGGEKIVKVNLTVTASNSIVKATEGNAVASKYQHHYIEAEGFGNSCGAAHTYLSNNLSKIVGGLSTENPYKKQAQAIIDSYTELQRLYDDTLRPAQKALDDAISEAKKKLRGTHEELASKEDEYKQHKNNYKEYSDKYEKCKDEYEKYTKLPVLKEKEKERERKKEELEEELKRLKELKKAEEKSLEELKKEIVSLREKMAEAEEPIYDAYRALNDARREVWSSKKAQNEIINLQEKVPLILAALNQNGNFVGKDELVKCNEILQLYLDIQDIYFSGKDKDKAYAYELPSRYILLDNLLDRISIVNCKSGQDRTGLTCNYAQARMAFKKDHGYYPRAGDVVQDKLLRKKYDVIIFEKGVSVENTDINEPGSKGFLNSEKYGNQKGYATKVFNEGGKLSKNIFKSVKFKTHDVCQTPKQCEDLIKKTDILVTSFVNIVVKTRGNINNLEYFSKAYYSALLGKYDEKYSEIIKKGSSPAELKLFQQFEKELLKINCQVSANIPAIQDKKEQLELITKFQSPVVQAILFAKMPLSIVSDKKDGEKIEELINSINAISSVLTETNPVLPNSIRANFSELKITLSYEEAEAIAKDIERIRAINKIKAEDEIAVNKDSFLYSTLYDILLHKTNNVEQVNLINKMLREPLTKLSELNKHLVGKSITEEQFKAARAGIFRDKLEELKLDKTKLNSLSDTYDKLLKIDAKIKRYSRLKHKILRIFYSKKTLEDNIENFSNLLGAIGTELTYFKKNADLLHVYATINTNSDYAKLHPELTKVVNAVFKKIENSNIYFIEEIKSLVEIIEEKKSTSRAIEQAKDILTSVKANIAGLLQQLQQYNELKLPVSENSENVVKKLQALLKQIDEHLTEAPKLSDKSANDSNETFLDRNLDHKNNGVIISGTVNTDIPTPRSRAIPNLLTPGQKTSLTNFLREQEEAKRIIMEKSSAGAESENVSIKVKASAISRDKYTYNVNKGTGEQTYECLDGDIPDRVTRELAKEMALIVIKQGSKEVKLTLPTEQKTLKHYEKIKGYVIEELQKYKQVEKISIYHGKNDNNPEILDCTNSADQKKSFGARFRG